MVRVLESKIIWSEGIKKLHVCLVIARGYQGRVNEVYVLNDTYVGVNNVTNLCIYRPKWRCTATLVFAFFVPIMLVATQSYKPLSAGAKFLMVSVPWFTSTLPAGKGIPTLLQVTVGRGKPSAWQVTWKVVLCTGAACSGGTLVNTGGPEIKKKNAGSDIKLLCTTMASWKVITGRIERTANYFIWNGNNINSSHILVQLVI